MPSLPQYFHITITDLTTSANELFEYVRLFDPVEKEGSIIESAHSGLGIAQDWPSFKRCPWQLVTLTFTRAFLGYDKSSFLLEAFDKGHRLELHLEDIELDGYDYPIPRRFRGYYHRQSGGLWVLRYAHDVHEIQVTFLLDAAFDFVEGDRAVPNIFRATVDDGVALQTVHVEDVGPIQIAAAAGVTFRFFGRNLSTVTSIAGLSPTLVPTSFSANPQVLTTPGAPNSDTLEVTMTNAEGPGNTFSLDWEVV